MLEAPGTKSHWSTIASASASRSDDLNSSIVGISPHLIAAATPSYGTVVSYTSFVHRRLGEELRGRLGWTTARSNWKIGTIYAPMPASALGRAPLPERERRAS